MDLRPFHRILLLLLSGISVTAWFNFSAFETHSIGMPGIALYLLVILRLTRLGRSRPGDAPVGVSLVFLVLCRLDLARFIVATALLVPLPGYWPTGAASYRSSPRCSLPADSSAPPGCGVLRSPLSKAKILFQREDPDLKSVLGTVRNLRREPRMTLRLRPI